MFLMWRRLLASQASSQGGDGPEPVGIIYDAEGGSNVWTQMLEALPSATVISQPRLLSQALDCTRGSVVSVPHTPAIQPAKAELRPSL